jgi:hypothetical protein
MMLAATAAAQPSHLDDQGFAPQLVEVKGVAQVQVTNSVIVTTVTAAVPIQRTQASLCRYFSSVGDHLTSGTSQTPALLFVNVSTNIVNAYINHIDFNSIEVNVAAHFHVYTDPVVTSSGTAKAIRPGDSSCAGSKMQVFHAPTVSSSGDVRYMISALGGTENKNFYQAFIIRPNSTVLVSVANSSNNRQTVTGLSWAEE